MWAVQNVHVKESFGVFRKGTSVLHCSQQSNQPMLNMWKPYPIPICTLMWAINYETLLLIEGSIEWKKTL